MCYCDGKAVGRVSTVKYLGAKLDEDFKFKNHVTELINKCAGRISFLYRNSSLLDFNCRRIMCNALVQPYLDYCCSSWYSSLTERLRARLDVLQRRMVKFILSKDMLYHVSPEDLRKLSWLSIPDRVRYFKLIHVFKIRQGKAPGYMQGNFVPISQSHSHNTRGSSYNYRISGELANAPTSFSLTSIKHWNHLPSFLKELNSEKLFKSKLKEYMFNNYWLQLNLDFQRTLIYSFYLLISFTSCLWKCVFCLFWRGPHWKQVDYLGVRLLWAILRFKRLHHCCILLFIEMNSFIHWICNYMRSA